MRAGLVEWPRAKSIRYQPATHDLESHCFCELVLMCVRPAGADPSVYARRGLTDLGANDTDRGAECLCRTCNVLDVGRRPDRRCRGILNNTRMLLADAVS